MSAHLGEPMPSQLHARNVRCCRAACDWRPGSSATRLSRSTRDRTRVQIGFRTRLMKSFCEGERRHELEYRSRYILGGAMNTADLLTRARHEARLTQSELATRARTSRPTLSAYEHGRTSPTLETAARLLAAAGQELTAVPQVKFVERA